jgi:hypothetical protein
MPKRAKDLLCNENYVLKPELRLCCRKLYIHTFLQLAFTVLRHLFTWSLYFLPENCSAYLTPDGNNVCFRPEPYLTWTLSPGSNNISGLGQDLLFLFLIGFVYQLILILIACGVFTRMGASIVKANTSDFQPTPEDEDVREENNRVMELVREGRIHSL